MRETNPAHSTVRSVEEVNILLTAARQDYLKALALRSEAQRLNASLEPSSTEGNAALRIANEKVSVASRRFERALQEFISLASIRRRSI